MLHNLSNRLICLLITLVILPPAVASQTLQRELNITLAPADQRLSIVETLQFPPGTDEAVFTLRKGFKPQTSQGQIKPLSRLNLFGETSRYLLTGLPESGKVQLRYGGQMVSAEPERQFGMPDFLVENSGVYLDGSSYWRTHFEDFPLSRFRLQVNAPEGWQMLSQGQRQQTGSRFEFIQDQPQDDIYLLGGNFQRYARDHNGVELAVLLLDEDEALANRYLDTSAHYIDMYSQMLGDYPYAAFTVVENRWQTGFGMPGFTLLGSRVLRLPFILHTSLPHEILHNWWGNGVYVDYRHGNWSEGLTAYLADHFVSEQRGNDAEYRRKANERYANFAASGRDFALADFLSRHNEASQAVGYSKSLMLFHMIRQQLGDELFFNNLRQFWQNYRYDFASFQQLLDSLMAGSSLEPAAFARAWLEQPGAPQLTLGETLLQEQQGQFLLKATLQQQQPENRYPLEVPVVIQFEDGSRQQHRVTMTAREHTVQWNLAKLPVQLQVDANFDLFRLLLPEERPATLGRLMGAEQQLMVLPTDSSDDEMAAWQQLASQWQRRFGNIKLVRDDELTALPGDQPTWLLGWNNRLLEAARPRFNNAEQTLTGNGVQLGQQEFSRWQHAVVLLDPDNQRSPLGFIGANKTASINALARKLPHYKSYGRLTFDLASTQNQVKQHLPVIHSPMSVSLSLAKQDVAHVD